MIKSIAISDLEWVMRELFKLLSPSTVCVSEICFWILLHVLQKYTMMFQFRKGSVKNTGSFKTVLCSFLLTWCARWFFNVSPEKVTLTLSNLPDGLSLSVAGNFPWSNLYFSPFYDGNCYLLWMSVLIHL